MSEQYGNVLVLGNSGVGKSALINALTGTTSALTVKGYTGATKEITIYTADDID